VSDDPLVALGRVVEAYGINGWIKVRPYGGADDSALLTARSWTMRRDAAPAAAALDLEVPIEKARHHSGTIVAKPVGSEDRDSALAFKGAEVYVSRTQFRKLADDEFYWIDLAGCDAVDGEGRLLGRVVAIDDHGAHPILSLDSGAMIPFVEAYVREVDMAARRIVVDWQSDW
jgi:16S rRNA processing protein RimM